MHIICRMHLHCQLSHWNKMTSPPTIHLKTRMLLCLLPQIVSFFLSLSLYKQIYMCNTVRTMCIFVYSKITNHVHMYHNKSKKTSLKRSRIHFGTRPMTRSGPLDWLRDSQDLKKHEFSKPLRSEKKTNVQLGERSPKVSSEALQKETWTAKVYHLIWIYQPPFGEPCKTFILATVTRFDMGGTVDPMYPHPQYHTGSSDSRSMSFSMRCLMSVGAGWNREVKWRVTWKNLRSSDPWESHGATPQCHPLPGQYNTMITCSPRGLFGQLVDAIHLCHTVIHYHPILERPIFTSPLPEMVVLWHFCIPTIHHAWPGGFCHSQYPEKLLIWNMDQVYKS